MAERLKRIGFADQSLNDVLKNKNVAEELVEIAQEASYAPKGSLLHHLALLTRGTSPEARKNRYMVSHAIANGSLVSTQQVNAAWQYVSSSQSPTLAEMEKESGVGVIVTETDVASEVQRYIEEHRDTIQKDRYRALPKVMGEVKRVPSLKWANPAHIKPAIDSEFLKILGPKDERDNPKLQAKKEKKNTKVKKEEVKVPTSNTNMFHEGFLAHLHKPGENPQIDPKLMEQHLNATHGKVFTRFPPEPNGFLHIGHAKAIAVDFGFAAFHHGECYLRFDDTNPEAEDTQFSDGIVDIVNWLGFRPFKITWSSDYFDKLYELAEVLIQKKLGYVCFCTPDEVKRYRGVSEDGTKGGQRRPCPCRAAADDPDKTLTLFRQMRDGKYGKGEATLRMKQDLDSPNPQMWDLVAYRVLNAAHHRTGSQWKIYPTYDFTHCLVDSLENISHSLCTLEFRLSRESYEWLCDAVHVYKPAQREFGRLNLTGSVMSKRKLLQLVQDGYVRGWDDPRLYTLVALRRRGVPPGAILNFISELGVTTTTSHIETVRFDGSIRKHLENTVPRLMMILDPVKVVLDNLPEDYRIEVDMPFKPGVPEMGEHKLPFTREFYIDRADFREDYSSNYFRMQPGQSVGLLRIPNTVRMTSVERDAAGRVVQLHAHYENDLPKPIKPKSYISWVAESPKDSSPIRLAEVREFDRLFKSDNPSSNPDGFLADLNPQSESLHRNAIVELGFNEVRENSPWKLEAKTEEEKILGGQDIKGAPESVRFQALRVGYYCMDKDSTGSTVVLNRIVTLKEDKGKE